MSVTDPEQCRVPGLLGMAVHTDIAYLRALHERANARRDLTISSLQVQLFTLNFALLVQHIRAREWASAEALVIDGIARLERGGADFAVVTSNTGSSLAEAVADRLALPLLSITDTTCRFAREAGCQSLGLLSTMRTSETGIYQRAGDRAGIAVVSPSVAHAERVEALIFDELISGEVSETGLAAVRQVIDWFAGQGCDGVAFACTDLTHMVPGLTGSTSLPIFDSTILHAQAAADQAFAQAWT
jgi:aspartate racemase